MAASGSASQRRERDKKRAALLKALGIVRQTQKCPVCYRIISCESNQSRYVHICK